VSVAWHRLEFSPELDGDAVVGFLRSLGARGRHGLWNTARPVIFEVTATAGGYEWRIGIDDRGAPPVLRQLRHHLPDAVVEPADRDLPAVKRGVELRLAAPMRHLRTNLIDATSAGLLGAMGSLATGEAVIVQWLVGPWLPRRPVPNPADQPSSSWPLSLLDTPRLDGESTKSLRDKQNDVVLGTIGRIATRAASKSRCRQLEGRVIGALAVAREPGAGLVRRLVPPTWVPGRLAGMRAPLVAWPCPLNAPELATVLGWPVGSPVLSGVEYRGHRQLPAPGRVAVPDAVVAAAEAAGHPMRAVAKATFPGRDGVLVQRRRDATFHTLILGPTGSGKSVLMANLIAQDIAAGYGVIVIESKGDLVTDVLARIPTDRIDHVVVLDPTDSAPVGLNPLAGVRGHRADLVVDQLLGLFHSLWRDSWGPRTNDVLHAALRTIVGTPDASLVTVAALLSSDEVRQRLTEGIAARDPFGLGPFWDWFDALSPDARAQVCGPLNNKLRTFLLRPTFRAVLGQTDPRFRLRDVFTDRKVLLVNGAKGALGPEGSELLGSVVLSMLWQQILERSAIPPERRRPVMVYVDEFFDYQVPGVDLAEMFAQARGMGVALTVATQHLSQLDTTTRDAVIANARSKIVFATGDRDAKILAAGRREITAEDIVRLGRYEVYASLVADGGATPFASGRTLPLPPATSSPKKVRAKSAANYGVPAKNTDTRLRQELAPPATPKAPATGSSGGEGRFGTRRRTP
jgi:hypothetical protein